MLSSVEKSITSPCWRRSSGTNPIPALIAAIGEAAPQCFSAQPDRARVIAIDSENRAGDFASARPDQPGQSNHLTGPDLERDVHKHTLAGETVNLENRAARRMRLMLPRAQLPTNHPADEIVRCEPRQGLGHHEPAVTQDGDPLAEHEHFLKTVRDEQHRGTIRAQGFGDS